MNLIIPKWRAPLLALRITTLILFTCIQVSAKVFSQPINITVKNASIEDVFKQIRKQNGYSFIYEEGYLKKAKPVTVTLVNSSIENAMQKISSGQPFTFEISENLIYLKQSIQIQLKKNAPLITVTGKVTDSLGNTLPGVSISLKNPLKFARTNENGIFVLADVPGDGVFSVSMIGFRTQEISINNRMNITIILRAEASVLDDIIITGIFERKASSFTGAAVTISREELKRNGNANLFQTLKNISPSMVLDNFDQGSNPNALPNIQIRGTSTFPSQESTLNSSLKGNFLKNPNEPLFILDGFETNIERVLDLDINRIESVTILKDAASKALYGSKAANGVIVIETTKISSNKPLITYNSSLDIELPDLSSYNLTNSMEKLEAERIDGMYIANPVTYDPPSSNAELQQLYNFRRKLALEGLDTYWMAKPLQNGIGQKHGLSIELGADALKVIGDVSYRDVTGAMIGSSRKNLSGSISTSYRLNNFLFRNIASLISNSTTESPYGSFSDYVKMNPYWRAVNEDGSIPFYAEIGPNGERYTNPLYNSTVNSKNTSGYLNFVNNFYLEWTMLPGLKATTRVGIDLRNTDADEFFPSDHTMFDTYTGDDLIRKGSYQVNNGKSTNLSGDLNVNYSKQVNKNFYFANVGFNVSQRDYSELIHRVEGFASDQMDDITFGRAYALNSRPSGINGITRDIGFLAVGSYMWDERFISDLTLRTNASSQFGADKRWAKFWSLGLGWNLHNEDFLKNTGVFDKFKIRGSVGSTGNQNFNSNASIATYEYYLESLYQGYPGSHLVNMSNEGLQWESKFEYNAGLDAKIKNLNLRFDYYIGYTENLLTDVTLPNSTGFDVVKDNLGRVQNKGIELFASYPVWSKGRNFVNLNFGLETNKNKIVELSNAMKTFNNRMDELAADQSNNHPVKKYEDGMSMNAIWAVPSLGIDPATGNEIYVDRDGNTTYEWNANDMIVAGNSMPSYQGVFGFNAEYNRIGISATGRYLGGGQLYNQTLVDRVENVDMNYNVDKRVLTGRWQKPGDQSQFKRLGQFSRPIDGTNSTESVDEKTRATTRFVQNRKEINIGAINVYYDFGPRVLTKLDFQRLRLSANMNEVAQFSTIQIERGLSYPFSRTVSFSLSATF
ncbi:TonB-dependent receptor [Arcticibacter svalbardensis MN12-7]|uniref:TonB-dependent receptor n=1 Tax=Arcticibacter svalbardensis MN12-7 TaxID=1150600 RepID=R9H544_9SPHI|nr:SusC/RagA family TonB-linked outer membrane protein [Arcticibacter svalbardensis]EOR96294.1 TonB-dependent receptor [Arcticibacter svalbardensis MN12-7]